MRHDSTPAPFESELTALLKRHHGTVAAVCNVEGLDTARVYNCLNEHLSHRLSVDLAVALLRGGLQLHIPAFSSLRDRLVEALDVAHVTEATDGSWLDEALAAIELVATALRGVRTTETRDMTPGEKSAVTAKALELRHLADRILAEMDGRK